MWFDRVLLSRVMDAEELDELVCWKFAGEGWEVRAREERRGVITGGNSIKEREMEVKNQEMQPVRIYRVVMITKEQEKRLKPREGDQ